MSKSSSKIKIIIAPLNWGWGHATRCIPIINEVLKLGYTPVIASDGSALEFLKKEFPTEEFLELSSYGIKYGKNFKRSMFFNVPKILAAIVKEHNVLKQYINNSKDQIRGIVSDNRLGVYYTGIPSVYVTHQLNIKLGSFSIFVNKVHHYFIKKHNECWVPDENNSLLSGDLSKSVKGIKTNYIGVLSRLKKKDYPLKYDLLVLLSGIEEQRIELEELMSVQLKNYKGKVLLVRGSLEVSKTIFSKNVTAVNYLLTDELEKAINQSAQIVSRSGYSTVMDLAKLEKSTFFIPTPGQTEQEYLAEYLTSKNLSNFSLQCNFNNNLLDKKNDEVSFKKIPHHSAFNALKNMFKPYQA